MGRKTNLLGTTRRSRWRLESLLEYRWLALGIITGVVCVLGLMGFRAYFVSIGTPRSWLDLAYLTLNLFPLNIADLPGPLPWQLEVARFLAPLVLMGAVVSAVIAAFRDRQQLFQAHWYRHHVVICGLGVKGFLFAKAFRDAGHRVTVIEINQHNARIDLCRDTGALVICGNAADPMYLRRAGVHHANHLISVCGNDGINAEIAIHSRDMVRERRGSTLTCLIHIADRRLANLLGEKDIATQRIDAFRLEFFSIFESGARALLRQHPPYSLLAEHPPTGTHLLVVGLRGLGESVVLQAAKLWYDMDWCSDSKLNVTVLDAEASASWNRLSQEVPQLGQACDATVLEAAIDSAEFHKGHYLFNTGQRCRFSRIYICLDVESEALSAALVLRQLLKGKKIPIVVCMEHERGLGTLLEGEAGSGKDFDNLDAFGLLENACKIELMENTTIEILAQAIHSAYVVEQHKVGETVETNPSMRPWEEIPEALRKSNRKQANHIGTKLRAVSCEIRRTSDWEPVLFEFESEDIEKLAVMEHERWVEERLEDGWRYESGKKNIEEKTSPYLVPWDRISEDIKDYDRNTVRDMPAFLAKAGFEVYCVE